MFPEEKLLERLKVKEGFRQHPYRDTTGHLSVGYGRNLEAKGIRKSEADYLLRNDMLESLEDCRKYIDSFERLDPVRQACLVEMAFNLGIWGLLQFTKMLTALEVGNWSKAKKEALNSRWATQVGRRAKEIAKALETGEFPEST